MSLWPLIVVAGAIVGLTAGIRQVAGLFMPSVTAALGTGIGPFATALAVASLLWGAGSIAAGMLADRYGPARVTAAGIVVMALGYWLMHGASSGPDLLWSGICLGIGAGFSGLSVVVGAVGRAASPETRTTAIAAVAIANGMGGFILFPYMHLFIEALGWHDALLVAVATLVALLPLAAILARYDRPSPPQRQQQILAAALSEAAALPSYRLLVCGFFVCGFHVAFYAVHVPAYAATLGLESWAGVTALSAVGAANMLGTYLSGRWGKHLQQRRGLMLIYLCRTLVFAGFLLLPVDAPMLIVLSALLGLFWLATVPLTSGLVATFFGTAWLSTLYGIVFFAHQVGGFFGAWLAGVLFDGFGSYAPMWWICIVLGVIATLLHWPIREAPVARLAVAKA